MAIEKITITKHITCKRCNSDKTVRKGSKNGLQYYLCKDCNYWFSGNDSFPNDHVAKHIVANAIGMYFRGIPTSQLDEQLKSIYGKSINQSTIYRWIIKYVNQVWDFVQQFKPEVGRDWFIDETAIKISGCQLWYWDVIDYKTRFLIATHISKSRSITDAKAILLKCKKATNVKPKIIVSDKLPAYLKSIKAVFPNTKHLTSKGFAVDINTNLIERFHGTLKQRYKVLRGLKTLESGQTILNGFLVFYNYLKPHEAIGDITPSIKAKINKEYLNWENLIECSLERW